MSPECQQLNRLYSTCVDGNKIKIPPKLQEAPKQPPEAPPFILDELHEAAKNAKRPQLESVLETDHNVDNYSPDAMESLLTSDRIAMSEFELIKLVFRWCQKTATPFTHFVAIFDFNILTNEEKTWIISQLPPTELGASMVRNALCQSSLLTVQELSEFKLHYQGFSWKRIYDSSQERLATFPETLSKALETFHRKFIVLRVDERLTLAMYIPRKIKTSAEERVDNAARLFAFPHSRGDEKASRLSLPTKMNYHIYCDHNMFQLYEGKRANTWVYMVRSHGDDSKYRSIESAGDRRRARHETVDNRVNFDCRCSVALQKFSRGLQTHIGRVNRNGVLGAVGLYRFRLIPVTTAWLTNNIQEVYIISNRDVKSMQNLDLWLEYIDTNEVLPLFDQTPKEYSLPGMKDVDWDSLPRYISLICRDQNFRTLDGLELIGQYQTVFSFLLDNSQNDVLMDIFSYLMVKLAEENPGELLAPPGRRAVLLAMLDCLSRNPRLAAVFAGPEDSTTLPEDLSTTIEVYSPEILTACILSSVTMGSLIVDPFKRVLSRTESMTLNTFACLIETASLTVRSQDLAMDILLECLERESNRILAADSSVAQHFVSCLIGIALDHIGEAAEQGKKREDLLELKLLPEDHEGYAVVEAEFRIDAKGGTPEQSSHVRLTAASEPVNRFLGRRYSMDALVLQSQQGQAKLQCLHPPPPFLANCSWEMEYLAPYVTTKTMLDAVVKLATEQGLCCGIVDRIIPESGIDIYEELLRQDPDVSVPPMNKMNDSQKSAITAALDARLTCLWGPPGTGKTSTIVEILKQLLRAYPKTRILVTAPTHNAVDNVMQRYLDYTRGDEGFPSPLRVSTEVC